MQISDDAHIIRGADIVIIAVPTPVNEDHTPDLTPLEGACAIVGAELAEGTLVIIESTVNPGACETVALSILEATSGLQGGADFGFAHCPERVNPGDTTYTIATIPRVVGALDAESLARATKFYRNVVRSEVVEMGSIKEAEAVKMVENSFRDINIAFVNELAMSFERAGIDITNVIRGASTKPFGFMAHYPGCGVGGHCIPVDPYYLIHYGRANGFAHRFLETARTINNSMPIHTVDRLAEALAENGIPIAGAKVALLGLSYKRDVGDTRESPALVIRDELLRRGARVRSYDPCAIESGSVRTLADSLKGAHAALIATDHGEFSALTPWDFREYNIAVVVDGRNCLAKEDFVRAGITYRGIGR